MGMTAIEKLLTEKIQKPVKAGEFVYIDVDLAMANDVTAKLTFDIFFNEMQGEKVWNSNKVKIIYDHYFPANDLNTANTLKKIRDICMDQGIEFFENEGICHQVMLERFVMPNQVVVGADSHTCTYGAIGAFSIGVGSTDLAAVFSLGKIWIKVPETIKILIDGTLPNGVFAKDLILKIIGDQKASGFNYKIVEFGGSTIEEMNIHERITLCNMVIEGGAKTGYIAPDEKTKSFLKDRTNHFQIFESDKTAHFRNILYYSVDDLEPMVACPYTVDNVKPVSAVEGIKIDQAFLGSCTNGRIEDLRIAAKIIKGQKIKDGIRMYVVPASIKVYQQALEEGLIKDFIEFGAVVNHPCCSNCWGACQALLGDGEKQISSANRNFKGRNGSTLSETYLASPATVAASALTGKITDPRKFL